MRLNERGTRSHGRAFRGFQGGPRTARRAYAGRLAELNQAFRGKSSALPARRVFALAWLKIEAQAIAVYQTTFNREFRPK
jgi:hypothetical protein